jgi:hypothetical protein
MELQTNKLRGRTLLGIARGVGKLPGTEQESFARTFAAGEKSSRACQKVWCGSCYSVSIGDPFPIRAPKDEDGFENVISGDELRFQVGRTGDNLMTPFQCDMCHFRNMTGRDPSMVSADDRKSLKFVRKANLDALWSREPSTVNGNLLQARKMETCGEDIGIKTVSPPMGPFPFEDTFGMKVACTLLRGLLDLGKWEDYIHFSTARRVRSAFSNVYHATCQVGRVSVMAYKTSKTYHMECPTYGYWFEPFMLECHKRMGDMVVSDYAVSAEIFKELLAGLDLDWAEVASDAARDKLIEFPDLLFFGYCCGLQGEEIMKVDVAGFLKYLITGSEHEECPHVVVPLLGRLKGETGDRYHI